MRGGASPYDALFRLDRSEIPGPARTKNRWRSEPRTDQGSAPSRSTAGDMSTCMAPIGRRSHCSPTGIPIPLPPIWGRDGDGKVPIHLAANIWWKALLRDSMTRGLESAKETARHISTWRGRECRRTTTRSEFGRMLCPNSLETRDNQGQPSNDAPCRANGRIGVGSVRRRWQPQTRKSALEAGERQRPRHVAAHIAGCGRGPVLWRCAWGPKSVPEVDDAGRKLLPPAVRNPVRLDAVANKVDFPRHVGFRSAGLLRTSKDGSRCKPPSITNPSYGIAPTPTACWRPSSTAGPRRFVTRSRKRARNVNKDDRYERYIK